jgi:hypothetical protein
MNLWNLIYEDISSKLEADDCLDLWELAVNEIFHDLSFLCQPSNKSTIITVRIGRCSHWLRPHQTRWAEGGGFAWPSGYGGRSLSRNGAPQHDWSTEVTWNPNAHNWSPYSPKRYRTSINMRISIPARTKQHDQAAIPVYSNGSPLIPGGQFKLIYGYRRKKGVWSCEAVSKGGDSRLHFEKVGEYHANNFS